VIQGLYHYPLLKKALFALIPPKFAEEYEKHNEMAMVKLRRRMEGGKERPDLIEGLLKRADEWVCRHTMEQLPRCDIQLLTRNRASRSKSSGQTADSLSLGDLRPPQPCSLA
jgi:hypothetical protein